MPHVLGRYEIEARIGQGAMADVYRARDPSIGRILAVKVLKPEYRRNRQYAGRFLREARAAGALSHPNIVTVYDVGELDGHPYIAMELLAGASLDTRLAPGAILAPAVVAAIGLQLADALQYAHRLGVVHRDIKPSNIMLGTDGRSIKILDFGIARMNEGDGASEGDEGLRTQIGQVIGTPRYMSPEQAFGQPIDGRSDLFSVGVVLYEMISGRKAFVGASPASLALQITQNDPPPLSEVAPNCPVGLRFIIEKLLAKDPDRRFASGAVLAEALRRELHYLETQSLEAPGEKRHLPLQFRLTLAMTAITGLVMAASVAAVLRAETGAMRRTAFTSGAAITTFVANNAAPQAAENAALPEASRDWLPVQAFVKAASRDSNIRRISVIDADGVVRASSDAGAIGSRQRAAAGATRVDGGGDTMVSDLPGAGEKMALRFESPLTYAGRSFGLVAVDLTETQLEAAIAQAEEQLIALALVTLGVVLVASYVAARSLAQPIRRLKAALKDVARGNLDFRISHRRRDEFGELFDAFNQLANVVQGRVEGAPEDSRTVAATGPEETRILDGSAVGANDSERANPSVIWRGRWARALAPSPLAAGGR